ncbi:hypothetical protein HHI36_002610 [Cryptolaemus montrouzieri]|uniref:DnaJ homolog subfamily C member 21 n=1 Tax=Cryptolaemus montrouzieri TaxID=559131 RepID=A0ABD2PBH2_9CUCU
MRCHYEVLNVAKDADDAEIKSAYKKLALKWHPDKNLEDSENAKEQFQFVQQAYEVLSDKQERAWYDRHREQILRGANSEFADNNLDVFQYFTTSCFKGYGDDENGFYTVYRKIFEQISKEDLDFYENKEDFCNIPSFGTSTSDYDDIVHPFYAHWMSYSTKKSYVWLDPYNIKDIRDRRLLKAVEKENKKIRQKAKRERNEEIRNLVAFVRKRDKRVQEWNKLNEAKIEVNRKKQDEIRKQKLEERRRLNESEVQAEWTKFENVTSELQEIEKNLTKEFGNSEESESDDETSDLYCAACNKLFKTEKSFQNHESSKKHKENVEILKAHMLEEDGEYEDMESDMEKDSSVNEDIVEELTRELANDRRQLSPGGGREASSSEEEIDVVNIPRRKKNKKSKLLVATHVSQDSDSEEICAKILKKPRNKKSRNVLRVDSTDDELKLSTLPASTSSDNELLISKKGKKKNKKGKAKKSSATESKSILVEDNVNTKENESCRTDTIEEDCSEKKETVLHICSTCKKIFHRKISFFNI